MRDLAAAADEALLGYRRLLFVRCVLCAVILKDLPTKTTTHMRRMHARTRGSSTTVGSAGACHGQTDERKVSVLLKHLCDSWRFFPVWSGDVRGRRSRRGAVCSGIVVIKVSSRKAWHGDGVMLPLALKPRESQEFVGLLFFYGPSCAPRSVIVDMSGRHDKGNAQRADSCLNCVFSAWHAGRLSTVHVLACHAPWEI